MTPVPSAERLPNASWNRSRWFDLQLGHWSTIYDTLADLRWFLEVPGAILTMALMVFPPGPLIATQAPHFDASSQASTDSAVPKILLGSLYPEKEHVPPETLPS